MINLGNAGDISKPATVLIKRISDAIGGVAKPWQIRRIAEAEADAQRTSTESEIELSDLRLRAGHRFIAEQTRIQTNIEDITRKSLPNLNEDSTPDKLEDDWIANFFDKCRNISDEEMQILWARILAGEANAPGSFSRKTVNLVADLEKRDAESFLKLCGCSWVIQGHLRPLVFDWRVQIYKSNGIDLNIANHLQTLGLITISSFGYTIGDLPGLTHTTYGERMVTLALPKESDNSLEMGKVVLTQAGRELARVCEWCQIDGFFDYVYARWASKSLVSPREPD